MNANVPRTVLCLLGSSGNQGQDRYTVESNRADLRTRAGTSENFGSVSSAFKDANRRVEGSNLYPEDLLSREIAKVR
jgi:hypothetical protein